MKAFTFRSVDHPDRKGIEIHVQARQVTDIGGFKPDSHELKFVQLTEDEALELLAWLRKWEGES